jgi:hypothetical protein
MVSTLLASPTNLSESRVHLESAGISILSVRGHNWSGTLTADSRLFFEPELLGREIFNQEKNSRWAKLKLGQILLRLPGATRQRNKMHDGRRPHGVAISVVGVVNQGETTSEDDVLQATTDFILKEGLDALEGKKKASDDNGAK